MKWMDEQKKHENLTYLALWGMLFAVPVLSLYIRSVNNPTFDFEWKEVFMIWKQFGIFLVIFLIHNFLLAPLLVYKQRRALYFSIVAVIIGAFIAYQRTTRPPDRPPMIVGQHDIVALIILVLMLGMNIGIKLYFKSRHDTKQLLALEKENLEQQLEYLRYQINPHFFMNTLNNIHALVDIDPEKAKETILELSKMMRFVLYEGDKKKVPMGREFEFIRHYITLMQLRYTDKVDVQVDLPAEVPDCQLPPLMLVTFIENAFKHGISYQHDSFIHIKADIKDATLHFECKNSKADNPNKEKGGVGLANVKQRLNLLYGENYTLNIQDEPDTYNVELQIPLT